MKKIEKGLKYTQIDYAPRALQVTGTLPISIVRAFAERPPRSTILGNAINANWLEVLRSEHSIQ
jgi:hypothetical protein